MANNVRISASIDDKVSSPLDKIRQRFAKFQSEGVKAGVSAAVTARGLLLIEGALHRVGDAISGSIRDASAQREAFSLTAQTFDKNTEGMKTWAAGAAAAFGQGTTEALSFASNFGTAFKNVGFALDETADKSKVMTRLAADLGSAFDAGADEAALALRSGLLGESEPLRRFGVFLDEAKVKAKAVQLGIATLGATLSDNQKVTARYALIMEQTAASQGMFGRDTDSLADAQKTLDATTTNLSARFGSVLLPVVTALTQAAIVAIDNWQILAPILAALAVVITTVLVKSLWAMAAAAVAATGPFAPLAAAAVAAGVVAVVAAQKMSEAGEETAAAFDGSTTAAENMRGRFTTEMARASAAVATVAGAAERTYQRVRVAFADIVTALKERIDEMEGLSTDAGEAIYGPIDRRAELSRINREIAETKANIASGRLRGADLADAQQKLRDLEREHLNAITNLAVHGEASQKELTGSLKLLVRSLHGATLQEEAAIMRLIAAYSTLAKQPGESRRRAGGPPGRRRAAGGPVEQGVGYLVGEQGPELFVPSQSGGIVPAGPTAAAMSGGSGGGSGSPVVIQVHLPGVGVLAEAVDRHLYYARPSGARVLPR
jgi:hypothetical protein